MDQVHWVDSSAACTAFDNMDGHENHQKVEMAQIRGFPEQEDGTIANAQTVKKPTRRPDIDAIRVSLTWGILLFHTTVAYLPGDYYINSQYPLGSFFGPLAIMFTTSMNIWNMPMFFFLSGISAYFALFKRTEQQFRDERVHRLMVPYLLMFLLQFVYAISYFGPDCGDFFFNKLNETSEMWNGSRLDNCPSRGTTMNISFHKHVRNQHLSPYPGQAWFLLPLFLFSQILAHLFVLWHPAHKVATALELPCCGAGSCCPRPFTVDVRCCCCITCCGKPASTPEELVTSTMWWLGGCFRLALLPGLVFGLIDFAIWGLTHYDSFYFTLSPTYVFMLIFGYVITAADDHGMKDILHRGRWIYFISGIILNILCSLFFMGIPVIPFPHNIGLLYLALLGFLRGFSKWIFILGWYCVTRSLVTSSYRWLDHLSAMAMPFYLTHQQILVAILSGTLWIPYLDSFPVTLVLATLATGLVAFVITKMTNVRYFFGLKNAKESFIPGKKMRGFIPVLILLVLVIVTFILASLIEVK